MSGGVTLLSHSRILQLVRLRLPLILELYEGFIVKIFRCRKRRHSERLRDDFYPLISFCSTHLPRAFYCSLLTQTWLRSKIKTAVAGTLSEVANGSIIGFTCVLRTMGPLTWGKP